MFLREQQRKEEIGGGREGRGEKEREERETENKTAVYFFFTRHSNYFDYIREKASVLC